MDHGRVVSWIEGLCVPRGDDGGRDGGGQVHSRPAPGCDSSPMWHVLAYRYLP